MFIGREPELQELNRRYDSNHFEMPVIYGRRRVGKTRLISEFIRNKRAIYIQARRTNAQTNLSLISQAILLFATGAAKGSYDTFDEAFDAVAALAEQERLIFVIDEFPYLAQAYPEISSLLQEKIDHVFSNNANLMLILCGSSLSFMEDQVLGYESPLYGRRTAQIKLQPLDFFTARKAWDGANNEDAARYYGITGGIPAYMEKIDPSLGVLGNIERLYLSPMGYLYEEPTNLLLQECKTPSQYDAIIQAIASGRSRLTEIATLAGIPESNTSIYLKKLLTLGIVKRELPFNETSRKRAVYGLADSMFRFWYRFVPRTMGLIQNGMSSAALDLIEPQLNNYMGPVFEEICQQYLYARAKVGELPVMPAQVSRWWGNDQRTKSQEEIDLIAAGGNDEALFVECKWRNEATGADVLDTLVFRSELFRFAAKHYLVCSKSAFTQGCIERAQEVPRAELITFDEMCKQLV